MIGDIPRDDNLESLLPMSNYQPSQMIKDFSALIIADYTTGYTNLYKDYEEFNGMSLTDRMNKDQRAWNNYVEPKSIDPNERWKWKGIKPTTRNKLLSIAAHLTSNILFPKMFAQNDQDKEDKKAANVMRDMIEWNIRNSDYEMSFLFGVIAALINPVAYFKAEFIETMQTIKTRGENGELTKEQVIDEVLSGFNTANIPADEVFIANPYQYSLQRQRFIGRRQFLDYDELESLFGDHPNWDFITPGIKVLYAPQDGMFYDQVDDSLQTLGELFTYYNRLEDTQVMFVNGIYFGEENVHANRIKHRDNKNRPKYPFVKFGFEPIDEKQFFYYKSAAFKLAPDQDLVNTMWEMVVNGSFLQVMPPIATAGGGQVDTSVMMPGAVTDFPEETKITPIDTGANLQAGFNVLQGLEQSITESSQDPIQQGVSSSGSQTAFEIARLEQNARIQLGIFGKMVGTAVKDLGELVVDIVIHKQTIGEVMEITGDSVKLQYQTFLLPDQLDNGKKVTKRIEFTDEMVGKRMSKKQEKKRSFGLMKQTGGFDADTRIILVNPAYFAGLKYKVIVEFDALLPKNEAFEKAIKLEAWDRMILSPFADREAVDRDFLFEPFAKGETDKYMLDEPQQPAQEQTGSPLVGQATRSEALGGLLNK